MDENLRRSLLKRIASKVLSENEAKYIIKGMDIIGDIAIIKIPIQLEDKKYLIANEILKLLSNIKVVLRKKSIITGPYRLMGLEWLAGEKRYTTIYREYGCKFLVDLSKVFFTPRLSGERIRIARMVRDGEVIVNMFAGVGTYSIIIAKHAKPKKVYSIDINPTAVELMKINVKMNKVEDIVIPILGDSAKIIEEKLCNIADRVLMPLPELSLKYLKYAIKALKNCYGYIHPYEFIRCSKNENPIEKAIEIYVNELEKFNVNFEVLNGRIVGEVAPRKFRIVLDLKLMGLKSR